MKEGGKDEQNELRRKLNIKEREYNITERRKEGRKEGRTE